MILKSGIRSFGVVDGGCVLEEEPCSADFATGDGEEELAEALASFSIKSKEESVLGLRDSSFSRI